MDHHHSTPAPSTGLLHEAINDLNRQLKTDFRLPMDHEALCQAARYAGSFGCPDVARRIYEAIGEPAIN